MTGGGYDGTSKGVPHFEFGSPSHGRKPALGTEQLELVCGVPWHHYPVLSNGKLNSSSEATLADT